MKSSKVVKSWGDKEGVFRMSARNWMPDNVVKANVKAIKTYQEIEPVKVPGDKFKSLKGLYIMNRGERL